MAVVVTYQYPIAATTTAPTVAQMINLSMVTAQLSWADSDTTSTITHSMNVSLAEGTQLLPVVVVTIESAGTALPACAVVHTNSISVAVNKLSAAGSGGTYNVVIFRPNTMMR